MGTTGAILVHAGMVNELKDWRWSMYTAVVGLDDSPEWLDTDWWLSQFAKNRKPAIKHYHHFILEGKGISSSLTDVRQQFLLGDDSFVDEYNEEKKPEKLCELSRAHRTLLASALIEFQQRYVERNKAMARAYLTGV